MTINEIKNENGMLHLNIAICDRDFHNHFIRCADCGTIVFKSDAVEVSDDYYCSNCITTCTSCGEIIPKSEVYTVADSGGEYCRHCYENETYTCDDCGTHFRYKDIDFDNGMLSIVRTSNYNTSKGVYTSTPKTKSSYRQLYLQPNILDLIKQLRKEQQEQAVKIGDLWEDNDRLFTTWCGKPMHPNTTYTWLNRFCENENIPFKGIHSFRHAVATQAITNGVDIKTVSSILGHSQTSTTLNIYAHAVQKSNVKALNLMADLLQ